MLGKHYTMPEAISTNITGSGLKRLRRWAQTLMWNHVCLVDAVVKLIAVMFLLILHQNTTAALFPFHYSTTSFQIWIHVSALTSKQHCLGCLLYHRSCYLSLEKSALLNSLKMYQNDLPSPDCIESELHCWLIKWQQQVREHGQASLPTTPTQTLRHATTMYPNIRVLESILCTMPVTSCSAE